jgi:hypothetical protein
MTKRNPNIHPAMTAIAAVIALSSPSFAQSASEPIAVTSSSAIEVTPAQVAADPLAPAPVVATPAAADPLAPEAAAKPAVPKATTAKSTAARPRPTAARAASAAPTAAAAPATISYPDAAAPLEPLALQPDAASVQAPIAEPPAAADANMNGSMVPIAGIAGLGIMALVGTGLVLNRRRRRAEDSEDAARRELAGTDSDAGSAMIVEPETEPAMIDGLQPETAIPATPAETAAVEAAVIAAHEPSPEIDGPVTELPEDFDVSRFGLHAQAAYNGPTEDNPSLSLKHRLSRANGMDQLAEREAEAEVAAAPDEAPAAKPVAPRSPIGDFVFSRIGAELGRKPRVRPAHS